MSSTDVAVAALGGVFGLLGDLAVRWPLLVIGFWIALAAVLRLAFPSLANVAAQNLPEILSDTAPVEVTNVQRGGAQTRMTLRQTFSGRRHIAAGAGTRTCYHAAGRWRSAMVSEKSRWPVRIVSSNNSLLTFTNPNLCSDMAISDKQPAAEQEASTEASSS